MTQNCKTSILDTVRCVLSFYGLDNSVLLGISVGICMDSHQIYRDPSNMREFHAKSHLLEVDMIGVGVPIYKTISNNCIFGIFSRSPKSSEIFKSKLQKYVKKSKFEISFFFLEKSESYTGNDFAL